MTKTEQVKRLIKATKVLKEDGFAQRKIIEQLTGMIKDRKYVLPKEFVIKAFDRINEYERRFTLMSKKEQKEEPVFTYKKGQKISLTERRRDEVSEMTLHNHRKGIQ